MFSKLLVGVCIIASVACAYGKSSGSKKRDSSDSFDSSSSDEDEVYCLDKMECMGDDIEADYVNCGGYYGCYEADMTLEESAYLDGYRGAQEATVSAQGDVFCGGYISCFMTEIVSYESTFCDGTVSCYNALIYSSENIYLTGYKAATATDIFGNSTDVELYAFGAYSALYSVINDVETIYNYGLYGLYFADIFTDGVDEFTLYSYGRYGTYYAQLYCKHNSECNVYCRDTGCYGFEIRCMRGATCSYTLNDDDCDNAPTILYAKSSSEEEEWLKLYELRKEMKLEAKTEFELKYKTQLNKMLKDENGEILESELKEFDFENKFEKIIESVKERMGLMDGKTAEQKLIDNECSSSNDHDISSIKNGQSNVIHVTNEINNGNKYNFELLSGIIGSVCGIVILAVGILLYKYCSFGAAKKLGIDTSGYSYQSI